MVTMTRGTVPPLVLLALVALTAVAVAQAPGARIVLPFDDATAGQTPEGFLFAASRQASAGTWQVRGGGTLRHLLHAADPSVTDRGISVAVPSTVAHADVQVAARIRLIDGDQAGGVVWRYRDANNFYFAGVALTERRAVLVRVAGGNRILLDIIEDVILDSALWHTISVTHRGDEIRGTINGLTVIRARDRLLDQPGHAGVWSAGNSTTWFDDILIDTARE